MSFTVDQFASDDYAPEVIKKRLQEICPDKRIDDMTYDEMERAIHTAFEIIGYEPNDLNKSWEYAYNNCKTEYLWDYIYTIWEADYGIA